jgi:hypothetical protein
MKFFNGHMNYNLGSTLAFKCIFCYDFISMFFIRTQYMIHDGKKMNWENYNKKFNEQKIMDFWMTIFGPYFQKSQSLSFFVRLIFFSLNMYNKDFLKWASFHMDFINWLITT